METAVHTGYDNACNKNQDDANEALARCELVRDTYRTDAEKFINQRDTVIFELENAKSELARQDRLLVVIQQENKDLEQRLNSELEEKAILKDKFHEIEEAYNENTNAAQLLESEIIDRETKIKKITDERKELLDRKAELVGIVKSMFEACKEATDELKRTNEVAIVLRRQNDGLKEQVKITSEKSSQLKEQQKNLMQNIHLLQKEIKTLYDDHRHFENVLGKNDNFVQNVERKMHECFQASSERNHQLEYTNWETAMLLESEANCKVQLESKIRDLEQQLSNCDQEKASFQSKQNELEKTIGQNKLKIDSLNEENEKLNLNLMEAEKRENRLQTEMKYMGAFGEIERENVASINALLTEKIEEVKNLEKAVKAKTDKIKSLEETVQNANTSAIKAEREKSSAILRFNEIEKFFSVAEKEHETFKKEKEEAIKKIKSMEETLSMKNEDIEKLKFTLMEKTSKLESVEAEVKAFQTNNSQNQSAMLSYSSQVEDLRNQIIKASSRLKESESKICSLIETVKRLEKCNRNLTLSRDDAIEEQNKKKSTIDNLRVRLSELENTITEREVGLKTLEKQKKDLEDHNEYLKQQMLKQDQFTIDNFKELSMKHKEEELELILECSARDSKVSQLMKRQEEAEKTIKKLEEEKSSLLEIHPKLAKCQEVIASQKSIESNLRKKIDSMNNQLKEADCKNKKAMRLKTMAEREKAAAEEKLRSYKSKLREKENEYLTSANKIVQEFEHELFDSEQINCWGDS